jgi:hypothetical protein
MSINVTRSTISVINNRIKVEQGNIVQESTYMGISTLPYKEIDNYTSTLPHNWISPHGSTPIILLNFSTLTLASDFVKRSAGISSVGT